jgi:phosphoglycerol transferase MdoB-like AlkP superfamily enzyme
MQKQSYLVLLKRVGMSFLFLSLTRLIFALYNHSYYDGYAFGDLFSAFVHGFRMDLAVTLIASLPFIIHFLIPLPFFWWPLFGKILFVVMNVAFLAVNIINWEFFHFIGKKMTFDLFAMGGDVQDQLWQLSYHYWYITLMIGLTAWLLWRYYPKEGTRTLMHSLSKKVVIPLHLLIFIITAIGIRGGVQIRSISAKDAFVHGDYKLGVLSLNASYGFLRSIAQKPIIAKKFFKSDDKAIETLLMSRPENHNLLNHRGHNIVLIIMESFCTEYLELGLMPYFDELKDKGLYLKNHFSNGKRSMDALPSLIAGIPTIIRPPIYKSIFQSNAYWALPYYLRKEGYTNWFFHGGKHGTMGFAAYTNSIGFDRYFSMEDYPGGDYDGAWGIWDHSYFNYMLNQLDQIKEPFFSSFFSLSAHQPFDLPEGMEGQFTGGKLPIHKTIQYSDYALKQFMEKASTKPWFKNTLFIITADHTHELITKKFNNRLGWYRVPMVLYHPEIDLKPYNTERVTQHVDIFPTVLDFLGIEPKQRLLFGRSLLAENSGRFVVRRGDYFIFTDGKQMIDFNNFRHSYQFYELKDGVHSFEKIDSTLGSKELLRELKAIVQYGHNGLIKNKLYLSTK